jgi:hypothetical protein
MFGKYFYNKNIRNIVILFGTIFNDINIRRVDSDGVIKQNFKIPIAYGPAQKYLIRAEQNHIDDTIHVGISLPRMSFEIITMTYDSTRKLQTTKKITELKPLNNLLNIQLDDGGSGYTTKPTVTIEESPSNEENAIATAEIINGSIASISLTNIGSGYTKKPTVTITGGGGSGAKATAILDPDTNDTNRLAAIYTPVPYNFEIDLSIMVLNSDDGAQILEQILPYFTPEFQVTMNEMATLGIKRDIPIILNNISTEDDYEGDFISRRNLVHTLSFTVQGYLYGPSSEQGIIREVDVNTGDNFKIDDETGRLSSPAVNVNVKPNPTTAVPDDNSSTTTTITDL